MTWWVVWSGGTGPTSFFVPPVSAALQLSLSALCVPVTDQIYIVGGPTIALGDMDSRPDRVANRRRYIVSRAPHEILYQFT